MQTFLPYKDYAACAQCLDTVRLGKQIIEAIQILKGQRASHPVSKMWVGYSSALCEYIRRLHEEWLRRGRKPHGAFINGQPWLCTGPESRRPPWLTEELCSKYRAHLLSKNLEHYGSLGWQEVPLRMNRNDYPAIVKA